jgi:hypothetical protein
MLESPGTRQGLLLFATLGLLVGVLVAACLAHGRGQPKIEINSYLVRDRIVYLDTIQMKSTIIVGLKIYPETREVAKLQLSGELYHNGHLVSSDTISHLDSPGNNLEFDLPLWQETLSRDQLLSIHDGTYLIVVRLLDDHRELLAECKKEVNRNQIGRRFYGPDKVYDKPVYQEIEPASTKSESSNERALINLAKGRDYIVFGKSYLERVYPHTVPSPEEHVESLNALISRSERKPLAFSIYPLKDLDKVRISSSPLRGTNGVTGAISLKVDSVGQLTQIVKSDPAGQRVSYRWAPRILEPGEVEVARRRSQTFWITIAAGPDAAAGDYQGSITLKPDFGRETTIPIHVKVLPVTLTDTDIQYGMMMTYAFYELDNEQWTERERGWIKKRGTEIYRDFREHGMTVVYPHSHFFYKCDSQGKPMLESLRADLEAYKALNFPGPFCWYLGHLLQTAKPSHPGSITNYEAEVAKRRLRDLLTRYEAMARDLGIPKEKLIVQVVDEADDRDRVAAGKALHEVAREMGFKTLTTRDWSDVDVMCTGIPEDGQEAVRLRRKGKTWWVYPNAALTTPNLAYTRYVFGFGAWGWGVKGVTPWTFQMSQGCNGNPFTVLDGPEVMVAYPGPKGLLSTPNWEAVRDGINDYKYVFLLEQLIATEQAKGNPEAFRIKRQLEEFKSNLGRGPREVEYDYGDWPPQSFDQRREQIVRWILQLKGKPKSAGNQRADRPSAAVTTFKLFNAFDRPVVLDSFKTLERSERA